MSKSTRSAPAGKPPKPRTDFPLYPHDCGRWAKKVRGKNCYFGKRIDDPEGERALKLWSDQKDDLLAGKPQPQVTRRGSGDPDGITVRKMVNDWLNSKRRKLEAGELTNRTFAEYLAAGRTLTETFGPARIVTTLTPADFGRLRSVLARRCGPVRLGNEITRIKMAFRFALDKGLIDRPIRYGQSFGKPSAKSMRLARAGAGSRMIEADEIRAMLQAAKQPMRAMILLRMNAGYGQTDLANLPVPALDLERGWATFPRPKTGIPRRAKLWPETVKVVSEALASRPTPESAADRDLAFLTRRGRSWVRPTQNPRPSRLLQHPALVSDGRGRIARPAGGDARGGTFC